MSLGDLQRHREQQEPFTVKQVAEELGISESLTRDLIRRGELAAYRFGPRKTVVYREDLEAFRKSRRVEASRTGEALEKN